MVQDLGYKITFAILIPLLLGLMIFGIYKFAKNAKDKEKEEAIKKAKLAKLNS